MDQVSCPALFIACSLTDQLRELLELAEEGARDGVGQHDVKYVKEE
jgi:hypothetical protein